MLFSLGGRRLAALRHFSTLSRILIKHGMGELSDRIHSKRRTNRTAGWIGRPDPTRVRRALEDLGPSFIKLGQLMSTRADMLPPEYIQELSKLQDHVPPVTFEQILPVIEQDLAKPWQEMFTGIEPEAIAAASVAQVHLARLKNGEQVALKIVRPGIEKQIHKDIELMRYVAAKLEARSETARLLGAMNLVEEFEQTIFRELDMQVEAAHIERFAHSFADSDDLYVPKVFWNVTTKSVLAMEHINGIKIDDVEGMLRHGIDPKRVALTGLHCFSRQLMETGFFHADPHPGNSIVMLDGRVSLIDFGIVGHLDDATMHQIANVFLGFAEHDFEMVIDAFGAARLIPPETVSEEEFRNDFIELCEPYYGRTLQSISVRDVYEQAMRLVHKYHLRLPRNMLLLFKTLVQTEALGKILGSDANLLEVARPYAQRLVEQGYETRKVLKGMRRDIRSAGNYLRAMPKLTHDLFKRLTGDELKVELTHAGLDQTAAKFELGLNRLTIGLVVSASIIAASLILNSSQNVLTFSFFLFGRHTLSITQLLGLVGYSIATILGIWLVVSIIRSGKL